MPAERKPRPSNSDGYICCRGVATVRITDPHPSNSFKEESRTLCGNQLNHPECARASQARGVACAGVQTRLEEKGSTLWSSRGSPWGIAGSPCNARNGAGGSREISPHCKILCLKGSHHDTHKACFTAAHKAPIDRPRQDSGLRHKTQQHLELADPKRSLLTCLPPPPMRLSPSTCLRERERERETETETKCPVCHFQSSIPPSPSLWKL